MLHQSQIYDDTHADLSLIRHKMVAIIGYGNQASAHAHNLRKSEVPLVIGLRTGSPSQQQAEADGHHVLPLSEAAAKAEVVMLLVPDEVMPEVYEQQIAAYLKPSTFLGFAHGFAIHYKKITPPPGVRVFMVAPKGPGYQLREKFKEGKGLPCLLAVGEEDSESTLALALSYAKAIGCTRQGALLTNFREETETDLFGEQAVLCGGVPSLLRAAFATLVEAGYHPDLAFIECVYELNLIVALLDRGGLTFLRQAISNTAEFGGYHAGDLLIDAGVRNKMQTLLREIQNGDFADRWMAEHQGGKQELLHRRQAESTSLLERVGKRLRGGFLQDTSTP